MTHRHLSATIFFCLLFSGSASAQGIYPKSVVCVAWTRGNGNYKSDEFTVQSNEDLNAARTAWESQVKEIPVDWSGAKIICASASALSDDRGTHVAFSYSGPSDRGTLSEQPANDAQNEQPQRDLGKDESYGYCIWQYTNVVNPKKSKALISGVFPYKDFSLTTVNEAWSNHVLANYDISGNGLVCFDAGKTSYEEAVSIRDREQAQLKSIYKTVIATGWLWRGSTRPSVRATSTPATRARASTQGKVVQKPVQKRR